MVHATVKRESDKSFTVTFDDVTTLNNQKAVPAAASGKTSVVSSSPLSSVESTEATKKEAAIKRVDDANKELNTALIEVKKARSIASTNVLKKGEVDEAGKKVGRAINELKAAQKAAQALGIEINTSKKNGGRRTHRKRTHGKRTHRKRK
jgi:vacuolar-type H+-ATPase subunit I/STV1